MNLIEIKTNNNLGRYVIVKESIKQGTLVVDEDPFGCGPKINTLISCLGCYVPINDHLGKDNKCTHCSWPMCNKCNGKTNQHTLNECEIFTKHKVKFYWEFYKNNEICPQLDCITPLSQCKVEDLCI